nr:RNA polymerase II-associated protein 3-like [Megalopta genalis]XP_033333080.1 RNA polymerase II-associated protein 3-like [Megalopta genalis]XP_033333081.1 RNA polymerase II-associated protein 3-like [Megalopta genalis]XP_033333082.1 RNA polymerase II-associated protein 3-like [Megalopta genalis]XP_033333083.1 RNA polymerase II-associated protein 3-like [Megalopta genalis]
MDNSLLMQKQVKDNAEDMQKEFFDMKNWEEQMKHKDEELRREASGQTALPPIRSKNKNKTKSAPTKDNEKNNKSKRIKSYDYTAWDKFDVDKACKDVDKEEQSNSSGDETISAEDLEKAHEVATKHKNEGNHFVQQQKWTQAIQCYNQAIKVFPYDAVFFANRALCQLKIDNFHSAESDCSAAVQLDETYVKAYHRRAIARMNLKQNKEAKQDLEKILKLEPSNKEAKSLLDQIEKKLKILDKNAMKSSEELIEKKIGEKLCSSPVSSIDSVLSEDTKLIKHTDEDKKDIKSNQDLNHIECTDKDNKIKENSKSVKDNETTDVGIVTLKQKEIGLRIPDWLPEKNDVIVIEPITRPAHLRSKKSLKKVPVEEVEFGSMQQKYKSDEITCNKQLETKNLSDALKTNNLAGISNSLGSNDKIPPVPKTAVQFVMNWRKNKSFEFRYKYLKQIPKNILPKIFQGSMESDIFNEILEVLRIEFIKRKESIFSYLEDLCEVKRFRALIMFMNNEERENLNILFEHCKVIERVPLNEVSALQVKYEI